MCTVCGCGNGEVKIEGQANGVTRDPRSVIREGGHAGGDHLHEHVHADGTVHTHDHEHADGHSHDDDHAHDHADGAHFTDHGSRIRDHESRSTDHATKMVRIERDILDKNDAFARRNRRHLNEHGIFALNLVSSPGSGKTTLLVETIKHLQGEIPVSVIEGDQQTSFDADRIRATGARAIQINTGKGCHLDAKMVEHALAHLAPDDDSLLLIENVGNLVCPAAFDLGEAHKVVVLSVTEGEDKPLKYPDMFAASRLMVLNKLDLLPHLTFDVTRAIEYARRVNPDIEVMQVSATRGAGMDLWLDWLRAGVRAARAVREHKVAALQRRVAELEVLVGRLS